MADPGQLSQAIHITLGATHESFHDCLQPGRRVNTANKTERSPFYPCNIAEAPLKVAATFVSFVGLHAFRNDGPSMVQDHANGQWTEPLPFEREKVMNFPEDITHSEKQTKGDRHGL